MEPATQPTSDWRTSRKEEYFAFWVLFFGGFFVGSALIRAVLLSFGSCSVMNL